MKSNPTTLYVGTYTRGRAEGIYICHYDPASGAVEPADVVRGIEDPAFLAATADGKRLYAVNELDEGTVSAFAVDASTGSLRLLNRQTARGALPCHLCLARTQRFLFAANYGSGSLCVLPVEADGRLGPPTDFVQHEGSGADPERQAGPHAHGIAVDPTGTFVFVADLGIDQIRVYRLDARTGKLTAADPPAAFTVPGAGPRHLAFHPSGRFLYVINELDSTIDVFGWDPARPILQPHQTISTLPQAYTGESYTAEIAVSPDGRFLYGSNRGHDSIAVFRIDDHNGRLQPVHHEPTRGEHPRHFAIDPAGRFCLVANQDSDSIVTFRIDPHSGRITPTGHLATVPQPACLLWA